MFVLDLDFMIFKLLLSVEFSHENILGVIFGVIVNSLTLPSIVLRLIVGLAVRLIYTGMRGRLTYNSYFNAAVQK